MSETNLSFVDFLPIILCILSLAYFAFMYNSALRRYKKFEQEQEEIMRKTFLNLIRRINILSRIAVSPTYMDFKELEKAMNSKNFEDKENYRVGMSVRLIDYFRLIFLVVSSLSKNEYSNNMEFLLEEANCPEKIADLEEGMQEFIRITLENGGKGVNRFGVSCFNGTAGIEETEKYLYASNTNLETDFKNSFGQMCSDWKDAWAEYNKNKTGDEKDDIDREASGATPARAKRKIEVSGSGSPQ